MKMKIVKRNLHLIYVQNFPEEGKISPSDMMRLHSGTHQDPFSVLGSHVVPCLEKKKIYIIIRAWRKNALNVTMNFVKNKDYTVEQCEDASGRFALHSFSEMLYQGAFEVITLAKSSTDTSQQQILSYLKNIHFQYELHIQYKGDMNQEWITTQDPYNFHLILSNESLQLFGSQYYWYAAQLMGSHALVLDGVNGVRFSVWAPQAKSASVIGDWNDWDFIAYPMRLRFPFGVWEIFVPHLSIGCKYNYSILKKDSTRCTKIDPYAREFENPPAVVSIISKDDDNTSIDSFQWTDATWIKTREALGFEKKIQEIPMAIYEIHLPSWMRGDNNRYLGYKELAYRIVSHVKNLNFTHVEFLPITHHPFEGSWGYQTSGYYAPYSRLGTPIDLKFLINELHNNGIGVFLDLAIGHFARDDWGLAFYDGEACYEYSDPREGEQKSWGTLVFNFRRYEVCSFLLGAVYYWISEYHFDGIRLDAVSSMIYRSFARNEGEWIPNEFGGDANLEGVALLQNLNRMVHSQFPGVFTIAEESTSWQHVTREDTGLGFDAKWDLGWMQDTLSYLYTPMHERPKHHQKLTFRGLYAANERWILPLSHDEVVHGKGSILDKCGYYSTDFQIKLHTLRSLLTFQAGLAARPLIFMGTEFGQGKEWRSHVSLDWHEASEPLRMKLFYWLRDVLYLYCHEPALQPRDDFFATFQWCDCDNAQGSIIAWLRLSLIPHNDILIICNFSSNHYTNFTFGVNKKGPWKVLLNSDLTDYGGCGQGPTKETLITTRVNGIYGFPFSLDVSVPSYASLLLKEHPAVEQTL